jgi:hypothetical protein
MCIHRAAFGALIPGALVLIGGGVAQASTLYETANAAPIATSRSPGSSSRPPVQKRHSCRHSGIAGAGRSHPDLHRAAAGHDWTIPRYFVDGSSNAAGSMNAGQRFARPRRTTLPCATPVGHIHTAFKALNPPQLMAKGLVQLHSFNESQKG